MIDDDKLEKVAEELHTAETEVTPLKNEMKNLPLAKKIAKVAKMKKLQQQVTVLHTQQKQRTDKVIEFHVEAERITDIIHPKHQRV